MFWRSACYTLHSAPCTHRQDRGDLNKERHTVLVREQRDNGDEDDDSVHSECMCSTRFTCKFPCTECDTSSSLLSTHFKTIKRMLNAFALKYCVHLKISHGQMKNQPERWLDGGRQRLATTTATAICYNDIESPNTTVLPTSQPLPACATL